MTAAAHSTRPRIVALLPMRHRSERVLSKNTRELAGQPLYHHILRALQAVDAIEEVVIDTDSPTIHEQCSEMFPRVKLLHRPEHLRSGDTPMNAVLLHDVKQVEADLYLQTHSTNPFLQPATIAAAVERFLRERVSHGYDSLFSVTRLQTRLYWKDGRAINHNPEVLERTQDLPPIFEENSNLYIFDRPTIERLGRRIGNRPLYFEIDRLEATDIDDEAGWSIAEALAHRFVVEK